jgi:hypothetical protein
MDQMLSDVNEKQLLVQRIRQCLLYLALVDASFLIWLLLRPILENQGIGLVFGWNSRFVWMAWLGAAILAASRLSGRHTGQVPCLELLLPFLMMGNGAWQRLMVQHGGSHPSTDEFLFAFERNYGYLAFRMCALFHFDWLHNAPIWYGYIRWVYWCSFLPLVVVYLYMPAGTKLRRRLWISFAQMGVFGVLFYQICPAAGPIYRFPTYPLHFPIFNTPQVSFLPHAVLNAMPSLHMSMALLTLLYARYCPRWVFGGAIVFAISTAIATLSLGEHYTIDLIVSVPFVVAIDKLSNALNNRDERRSMYLCFIIVLLWESALRRGTALELSTPAVWLLSIGTILMPFVSIPSLAITSKKAGSFPKSAIELEEF